MKQCYDVMNEFEFCPYSLAFFKMPDLHFSIGNIISVLYNLNTQATVWVLFTVNYFNYISLKLVVYGCVYTVTVKSLTPYSMVFPLYLLIKRHLMS